MTEGHDLGADILSPAEVSPQPIAVFFDAFLHVVTGALAGTRLALGLSLSRQIVATRIPTPPGSKSGRKTVADLQDWVRRGPETHPRRTVGKLGQTRRIRQAIDTESESNTKSCASGVNCGDCARDSGAVPEVSDRSTGFGKPPSSSSCGLAVIKPQSIPNRQPLGIVLPFFTPIPGWRISLKAVPWIAGEALMLHR